jgi:hypothetical protein
VPGLHLSRFPDYQAASWIWWIIAIFVTIIAVEFTALYILLALTRDKEKPASAKTLIVLGSGRINTGYSFTCNISMDSKSAQRLLYTEVAH